MPADKPTELSRIKLKNFNSTARPYDQQAFSPLDLTPSCYLHLALAICMFVVVNFDALAQPSDIRIENKTNCFTLLNAGFEPKVSDTYSPADWMPADKPTEISRINLKNLNSTARPYDQQAFSPLDLTACWLSHLALAIYMFVVVNFDALAQASDIRIERRQVVFLCWMQDSNQVLRHLFASRLNAYRQTDWAIENQAKKLELDSPSLWSTSIQPTRLQCQLDFALGSGDIHVCC